MRDNKPLFIFIIKKANLKKGEYQESKSQEGESQESVAEGGEYP